jgi:hypothetical protein
VTPWAALERAHDTFDRVAGGDAQLDYPLPIRQHLKRAEKL